MSRTDEMLRIETLDSEVRRRYAILSLSTSMVPFQTRRRGALALAVAGVSAGALASRVPVYGILVKVFSIPAIAGQLRASLQPWIDRL